MFVCKVIRGWKGGARETKRERERRKIVELRSSQYVGKAPDSIPTNILPVHILTAIVAKVFTKQKQRKSKADLVQEDIKTESILFVCKTICSTKRISVSLVAAIVVCNNHSIVPLSS